MTGLISHGRAAVAVLLTVAALAACAAPAAGETVVDFPYAGAGTVQHFPVPPGIYWITIHADGAHGGTENDIAPAGRGGAVTATVPVQPGHTLAVYVAEYGYGSNGGWGWAHGGRHGSTTGDGHSGGGGGGATAVLAPGGEPLVVAGGGGGGGGDADDRSVSHGWGGAGGNGNGSNGSTARGGDASNGAGGCGGCLAGSDGNHGENVNGYVGGGGGGGGGYHGGHGGSGGDNSSSKGGGGGGGGGGSSFAIPGALDVDTHAVSSLPRNGYVRISFGAAPAQMTVVSGDHQHVPIGAAFAPLKVKVTTDGTVPAPGVPVRFTLPDDEPTGRFPNGGTAATATTGPDGIATAPTVRAGAVAGQWGAEASVAGVAHVARFTLRNDDATTTTAVTSSRPDSSAGEPVRFTAHVSSGSASASIVPSGNVQFSDGIVPLGPPVPLDGEGRAVSPQITDLAVGAHTIEADYLGDRGHAPSSGEVDQEVLARTVGVKLVSTVNPSSAQEPVLFSATITGGESPGGSVQFAVDGVPLGAPVPVAGAAASSVRVDDLAEGAHAVTAAYSGDAINAPAHGAMTQAVGDASTAVDLSSSADPAVYGAPLTLAAAVRRTDPGAVPTGEVAFRLGGDPLCPPAPVVDGHATCRLTTPLAPGAHLIAADFAGSGGFEDGTGTLLQHVVAVRTATTVSVDPSPTPFGTQAWLHADVTADESGAGAPAGSVQFSVDGDPLGPPVPLVDGHAAAVPMCGLLDSVCTLSPGPHRVEARYVDDAPVARFAASQGAVPHRVVDARTTTTVSSDAGSGTAPYGRPITFTATVSAPAGTGGAAGGVQFLVDGTPWGEPVALRAGRADALAIPALAPGTHEIVALYEGASGFAPSEATLTQVVAPPAAPSATSASGSTPPPATEIASPVPSSLGPVPRAVVQTRSARVSAQGTARVAIGCEGPSGRRCRGRLAVARDGSAATVLAQRRYSLPTGARRRLAVDLDRVGSRLLSRQAHVRARVALTAAAGSTGDARALLLRSTAAPPATVPGGRHRVTGEGRLALPVRCHARHGRACHVELTIRADDREIARTRLRIDGHRTRHAELHLPRSARHVLARDGRVEAVVRVRSALAVGRPTVRERHVAVSAR